MDEDGWYRRHGLRPADLGPGARPAPRADRARAEAADVVAYLSVIDPEDVAAFSVEEQSRWYAEYYEGEEVS